ncbi:tRNA (adenosine(37)-N6)-threonylcarbamoyltransferase complex ATPase subunit type 1 TsaE [Stieleria marina]|uniref:tRNA threonylcarbamoyladenosine biosynthesis protein TsaE n=1 Tax=Stieleria marina TaxID=1930275 RepID=A0A517NVR7_9BACT|nr:tRNA threonylcarbamoyladenosine biosynthesis protein TsaE [Planctomycetes bacterium K23_9]
MTTPDSASGILISALDLPAIGRFADQLVSQFPDTLVIGLVGTLGAGKTTLVQSIAAAAKIDVAEVTSPTFTLLQTHRGTLTLHHLDAYRLADEDEFLELGVDELFEQPGAWTLVEWADRIADVMPTETLWITIELTSDDARRDLRLTCDDDATREKITAVARQLGADA